MAAVPERGVPLSAEGDGSAAILAAHDLSKTYRVYARPVDRLKQGLFRSRRYFTEVPSVRQVSLKLAGGEVLGIVGQNGSGKSTLLKLLAGVLTPTSGSVERRGRLAAMIELGAGFDLSLSGRENARLGAMLMGLDADAAEAKLPEIEAFADIGEFFDFPLSTCSSGMLARVAFAVFTCLEPDVLLVDEILAVGDEAFQRKCFARIRALAESGCSIIIVSHSAQLIIELCDRALLMDHGECLMSAAPDAVVAEYHRLIVGGTASTEATAATPQPDAYLDPSLVSASRMSYPEHGARIIEPRILDAAGNAVNVLKRGKVYRYSYRVQLERDVARLEFGSLIKTVGGLELGGVLHGVEAAFKADSTLEVQLPFTTRLLPGTYFLNAGVRGAALGEPLSYLHRVIDALAFRVDEEAQRVASGTIDFTSGEQPQLHVLGDPRQAAL